MLHIEWKWNIPNALSLFRIVLLPVFVVLYLISEQYESCLYWAFGILLLSGVTDSLDGIIARKFNQITDVGKVLDPVADKLTQVVVVVCLATRYVQLIPLVIICLCKEAVQMVGGLILLRRGEKMRGAEWYGKVSTFVFYGVMALIVLFPNMPIWLLVTLVCIVSLLMLFSFANYIRMYLGIKKTLPPKSNAASKEKSVHDDAAS